MPTQSTQIFLGSTPIPLYYLGDTQMGINPASVTTIPTAGLVYLFDATNVASYPTSGSIWYDLSPNKTWASTFSSSVFPTFNSTEKSFIFNGSNTALVSPLSSSIATASKISDFTQIAWVKLVQNGQTGSENGFTNLQSSSVLLGGTPEFDSITFNSNTNVWRLSSALGARNVTSAVTETVFNDYLMIAATRTSGVNNFKLLRNGANVIATGSYSPITYLQSAIISPLSVFGNRFWNGDNAKFSDGWITGSLSAVILYNRVLSDAEINQIYEVGRSGIVI